MSAHAIVPLRICGTYSSGSHCVAVMPGLRSSNGPAPVVMFLEWMIKRVGGRGSRVAVSTSGVVLLMCLREENL